MNKRIHAYYSGSVQGVGFRYMVERAAASLKLSGWVKNLPDGRVEILCEGNESDLKIFLGKIEDVFDGHIKDKDIRWCDATGEFGYFDIRF